MFTQKEPNECLDHVSDTNGHITTCLSAIQLKSRTKTREKEKEREKMFLRPYDISLIYLHGCGFLRLATHIQSQTTVMG